MNLLKKHLISIFLIVLLMNTAYGFPDMGGNTTTAPQNMTIPQTTSIEKLQDLKNATESDQDIIIAQHLIEYDAVQLQSENKLFIRETLTFKNLGTKDFYGSLRTWLPDGSENINIIRSEMMSEGGSKALDFEKNENIISWKDFVEKNSVKYLYIVEYTIAMEQGKSSIPGIFSKKLTSPTVINYKYVQIRSDLAPIVVKITKPQESSIKLFDENRNDITPVVDETGNIYRFDSLKFQELNIEMSKSSSISTVKRGYADYIGPVVIFGILILLVLSYPYIIKKMKSGEADKTLKGASSSDTGKSKVERSRSDTEMDPLRKELGLKLKELETKYKSGDLLDEEYEEEKKDIQNKLRSMNKQSK